MKETEKWAEVYEKETKKKKLFMNRQKRMITGNGKKCIYGSHEEGKNGKKKMNAKRKQ